MRMPMEQVVKFVQVVDKGGTDNKVVVLKCVTKKRMHFQEQTV